MITEFHDDEDGNTPLHHAADTGNNTLLKSLLEEGSSVGCKNDEGKTPLHLAVTSEVVQTLIQFGADVHAQDYKGRTPLHVARKAEIVEILIQFGADVDAIDKGGQTPLHLVAASTNGGLIGTFLSYGADINISNNIGLVPFDFCLEHLASEYVEQFLAEIILRLNVNRYVSGKNQEAMYQAQILSRSVNDFVWSITDIVQQEVEKLKCVMVENCLLSFYDFLTKPTNTLEIIFRNRCLTDGFQLHNHEIEFPMYSNIIDRQFRKILERKVLIEQGCEIFEFLCYHMPKLPSCCLEEIFSYLSNKQLKILITACKPTSLTLQY